MSAFQKQPLAPKGTTGTATHQSVGCNPAARKTCAVLIIEAVGATPTITAKVQGTFSDPSVPDASADWFDLGTIVAGGATPATEAVGQTQTALGPWPMFIPANTKFARRIRIVTSANTNVTYRAELHEQVNP